MPALTLRVSSCWSNLTVESPLSSANPTDMVQSYCEPQLRRCIWCCVPLFTSCSHNLIKHETHSVKLKIDSPLSHSQTKRGKKELWLVHRGAARIGDKSETYEFIAITSQSDLTEWNWLNRQNFSLSLSITHWRCTGGGFYFFLNQATLAAMFQSAVSQPSIHSHWSSLYLSLERFSQ